MEFSSINAHYYYYKFEKDTDTSVYVYTCKSCGTSDARTIIRRYGRLHRGDADGFLDVLVTRVLAVFRKWRRTYYEQLDSVETSWVRSDVVPSTERGLLPRAQLCPVTGKGQRAVPTRSPASG